jgi:translocation and assembly module TamA
MTVPNSAESPNLTTARTALVLGFLVLALSCRCVLAAEGRVEVRISGIEDALRDNIHAFLSITELEPDASLLGFGSGEMAQHDEREVRRLHRRAAAEIRRALQPFGYYRPHIDTSLTFADGRWLAEYDIDPGPPVIVRGLDIRVTGPASDEAALRHALDEIRLEKGQRLEHQVYETTKKNLIDTAFANGYIDARFQRAEMRVSVSRQRADIVLLLDSGPQYLFGPIEIEQAILDPDFVARYVDVQPGTPFDARKLLDLQLALSDSGYFGHVEVRIDRDRAEDYRIPITVQTEPAKPRRYGIGGGYGTDTGPRVSLAAEFRRINRRGHSILAEVRASQIKNTLGLHYRIPIKNVATDKLVFSGTRESGQVSDDGDTDRTVLGVSENTRWRTYHRRLYLNFQRESFDIGEDDDNVTYLIPGASLSRLKSDNVLAPRRGYSWTVDLRGSAGKWLSETSFARGEAAARMVLPVGERSRLLLRGQAGTAAVEDFSVLPTSERFFAGGDQSVRGYAYESIGPRDNSGDVVGGRHLMAGSVELDRLFVGNFGAAIFVDSGDAFNGNSPDFKTGAGVGFRWRSPVGMLRVDLAHPFNDSDDDLRLHISIGPDL